MEAVLDVDNIAYCTINIEGSRVPPSANMVDSIYIQDGGFGSPIPVLQLILNDQHGSLDEDLNLQDGTLITIKLAKQRDSVKTRKFRVFHFNKQTTSSGPKMVVTCLFDAPKWNTGVYTESYRGNSDSVMSQIAAAAGLDYDGASGTDDVQTWLNINKTRTAFSEDIAMRGYVGPQSCMYRVLTVDKVVKYKDVFKALGEAPKWSLHMNTDEATAEATPIVIRETQNASSSGIFTHMMNYGQYQYEHSLDVAGQQNTTGLDAPVFGSALPINADVRSEIAARGARVSYTGWDTGTEPKPASNLHTYYEKAMYQNMRYLGLMSERVKVLTDEYTETEVFDCVTYKHAEQDGSEFKEKKGLGGKWIIGGRTIWIKAGHKYCEVFFLYRPTLNETGSSPAAGEEQSQGQQNAKANSGDIDLVAQQAANEPEPAVTEAAPEAAQSTKPATVHATEMLTAMGDFADGNSLTSPAITGTTVNGSQLGKEQALRDAVQKTSSAGGPIASLVNSGKPDSLEGYATMKKYESATVEAIARRQMIEDTVDFVVRAHEDPAYLKSTAIHRVTDKVEDITGIRMHNIVSAAQGNNVSPTAIIGDVINGGLWADDLRTAGIEPDQVTIPLPFELPINENVAKFGGTFLYSATGIGLSPNQILIKPYEVADNIERWSRETSPENILIEQGYRAYTDTFGDVSPSEAGIQLENLGALAAKTALLYSRDELVVDEGLSSQAVRELGRDIAFTFGDPSIVPVVNAVERVVDYGDYSDIQTAMHPSTWADYHSMGIELGQAVSEWDFPFEFPGQSTEIGEVTGSNTGQASEEMSKWLV